MVPGGAWLCDGEGEDHDGNDGGDDGGYDDGGEEDGDDDDGDDDDGCMNKEQGNICQFPVNVDCLEAHKILALKNANQRVTIPPSRKTLHYITEQISTLHYITLRNRSVRYMILHYTILYYSTLYYISLR